MPLFVQPSQTCLVCGRTERVVPDGRGHPPTIARNRLVRRCNAAGCRCRPQYHAGVAPLSRAEGQAQP